MKIQTKIQMISGRASMVIRAPGSVWQKEPAQRQDRQNAGWEQHSKPIVFISSGQGEKQARVRFNWILTTSIPATLTLMSRSYLPKQCSLILPRLAEMSNSQFSRLQTSHQKSQSHGHVSAKSSTTTKAQRGGAVGSTKRQRGRLIRL